jgi:hypothetical protein
MDRLFKFAKLYIAHELKNPGIMTLLTSQILFRKLRITNFIPSINSLCIHISTLCDQRTSTRACWIYAIRNLHPTYVLQGALEGPHSIEVCLHPGVERLPEVQPSGHTSP